MSGSLTFTPAEADLLAAYRLAYPSLSSPRIIGFIAFGAVIGLAIAGIDGFRNARESLIMIGAMTLWAIVVLFVIVVGVRLIWMPRYSRRIFTQQKDLQSPITLEWTDTHFITTAHGGRVEIAWTDFYRWRRNEAMLLLYRSEALFNFVPIGNPEAAKAADEMQALLEAAGVVKKK
jgi:hypothetical protein